MRNFILNRDSFFARVRKERPIDDHGTIIMKLVEETRIERKEFDERRKEIDETPR